MQPTIHEILDAYETMVTSRVFDEACGDLLSAGTVLPHYHSGIGQEALMVGAVAPLRPTDQIIYTHRGYGHLLAKGIDLASICLDLLMKQGGTNHGLGGVMHVNRPEVGVHGREGVFGTRFGIAVGLALASALRHATDVTVCFYGEAAGARGALYEALNMCKLWQLPVVFVAENNGWSFTSRTEWLFPSGSMTDVWNGFVPVQVVDGNDLAEVWDGVSDAVERARAGGGPQVLEAKTYRLDPHIWWDEAKYQPAEEIERRREFDPIVRTRGALLNLGTSEHELDAIRERAAATVEAALGAAFAAPAASWESSNEWVTL